MATSKRATGSCWKNISACGRASFERNVPALLALVAMGAAFIESGVSRCKEPSKAREIPEKYAKLLETTKKRINWEAEQNDPES